jgi:hypothetical protein
MKKRIGLVLVLPFLFACHEVRIKNGEIPQEYMALAEHYVGEYQGKFDSRSGSLVVSLMHHKLIMEAKGFSQQDILNDDCHSKIGVLKRLYGKKINGKNQIQRAVFDFDPGACSDRVEGRELLMEVKEDHGSVTLSPSLLIETEWRSGCDPYQTEPCRDEAVPKFAFGRLVKSR